jgi:hypothetical protein
LLPPDTLALFTARNWPEARADFEKSFAGQLWRDPAMQPFREKFLAQFDSENFPGLQRELGANVSNFLALARGQVTLALTQNGWDGLSAQPPAILFLLDATDQSAQLKTELAALKKGWLNKGQEIKTETIRDVEFTRFVPANEAAKTATNTLLASANKELSGALRDFSSSGKGQWLVGQADSLLIAGTSSRTIEQLLTRFCGGAAPCLADLTNYVQGIPISFREANSLGWVNTKLIGDALTKRLAAATGELINPDPNAPRLSKLLPVLGAAGFQALAFSARQTSAGSLVQIQLNVPEAQRKGLFKIFTAEVKGCDPPPFVPADAVKFCRWRLDLQKGWGEFTNSLVEMFPSASSVVRLLLDNAGKDIDLAFDARTNLIANLGDDVISFEKNPRTNTLVELKSPPRIVLVGARNANQLAGSLRALTSILPTESTHYQEREFLGRKVYSMTVPNVFRPEASPLIPNLHYAALSHYVVFANYRATLEEFLRSNETHGKGLGETPGLAEAAQHVGGTGTGFFGFENQIENMRTTVELLKRDSGWLAERAGRWPLATMFGLTDAADQLQHSFDFSLMPPYESISKYFHFTVRSGTVTPEGFTLKILVAAAPSEKKP